jgi:nucleoside-diphosphate-sugar epimerase
MAHVVLVTGTSGYIGAMLVRRFAAREDVAEIIGIDKEPCPPQLRSLKNYTHLTTNVADDWEEKVRERHPDIIIHSAWQIREMYGAQDLEWEWNIGGSDKVFEYAFSSPEVARLVDFSTVASYGAFSTNTMEHRFTEEEPFRKTDYRYAEEKRIAEAHLEEKYEKSDRHVTVAVVRPAAITGPRGRYMRIRFGLQSALAGQLKDSFVYRLISALVAFVPVTPSWLRQFVHEDDVVNIVELLAFQDVVRPTTHVGRRTSYMGGYEVFNLCPPGVPVLGADMARAVGKSTLSVPPWLVRIAFFKFWHLTRGRVPTGRGAWKSYSYPIAVDGSKVTRVLGYEYKHQSLDAFRYTDGEYEEFVPEKQRLHKP